MIYMHENTCECPICKKGLSCPKCKSKDFEEIESIIDEDGAEIRELKCKKCGNRIADIKIPTEIFEDYFERSSEHPTLTGFGG